MGGGGAALRHRLRRQPRGGRRARARRPGRAARPRRRQHGRRAARAPASTPTGSPTPRSTRRPCTRSSSCTSSRASCSRTAGEPIGVVTAIAAPHDFRLTFRGAATHAGATPMRLRRDALAGAAEAMVALERIARASPSGTTVGTVGVVARRARRDQRRARATVELDVDVRDADLRRARGGRRRGSTRRARDRRAARAGASTLTPIVEDVPVACDPARRRGRRGRGRELGLPYRRMTSGAYHDAMIMGARVPIGMIFVPSTRRRQPPPGRVHRAGRPRARGAGARRARSRGSRHERPRAPARGRARRRGARPRRRRRARVLRRSRASGSTATSRSPAAGSRASGATTAASGSTRAGRHLVPGLIDAHVHLESSKLLPSEFARVVVARGTTAVVCDPHEIANVLGAARRALAARRDRGAAAARLRDGAVVRPGERAGVAARPARDRRHGARSCAASARSASPR